MSRRAIDPDEKALWHNAMRDVARPRGGRKAAAKPKPAPMENSIVPAKARTQGNPPPLALDSRFRGNDEQRDVRGNIPGLDRRNALRLKRGQMAIEARLDLHGMIQAEAHRELAAFIARCHAVGKRTLLVVTGKGTRDGTGVLRAAVPRWLAEPGLRHRVLAAAPATPRDGGGGALYILLRRAR
jgi:DNA-nicking Smr family endonuclease